MARWSDKYFDHTGRRQPVAGRSGNMIGKCLAVVRGANLVAIEGATKLAPIMIALRSTSGCQSLELVLACAPRRLVMSARDK